MTIAALIPILLKISIALTVFSFGLQLKPRDLTFLFRDRRLLLRSLLAMSIVMPLVAAALVTSLRLHPAVEVALVALALSPIPPLLPRKQLRAGGGPSYVFSLLVTTAVLAVVLIPIGVELFELTFGITSRMPTGAVATLMLIDVLVPLAAGMLLGRIAPAVIEPIARPVQLLAPVLLVACTVAILVTAMPNILLLTDNGTLLAVMAFIVAGLAAGHLLGGPAPDRRTVLALSTASRHPGVALAIASASAPDEALVPAAVFLYLITNLVLSMLYLGWQRGNARRAAAD